MYYMYAYIILYTVSIFTYNARLISKVQLVCSSREVERERGLLPPPSSHLITHHERRSILEAWVNTIISPVCVLINTHMCYY